MQGIHAGGRVDLAQNSRTGALIIKICPDYDGIAQPDLLEERADGLVLPARRPLGRSPGAGDGRPPGVERAELADTAVLPARPGNAMVRT